MGLTIVIIVLLLLWCVWMWTLLTEGSYLGGFIVRWSYDLFARRYEGKWQAAEYTSPELTEELFLGPILSAAGNNARARVVDLACGTGRGSRLLLADPRFLGRIVAVDFSAGMLDRFRAALAAMPEESQQRVSILQQDVVAWSPAAEEHFDAAMFLEAAELIPGSDRAIRTACQALRPGGVLVTTLVGRKFRRLFSGRGQSEDELRELLTECGLVDISIRPWRSRYDVVTARKPPDSAQLR